MGSEQLYSGQSPQYRDPEPTYRQSYASEARSDTRLGNEDVAQKTDPVSQKLSDYDLLSEEELFSAKRLTEKQSLSKCRFFKQAFVDYVSSSTSSHAILSGSETAMLYDSFLKSYKYSHLLTDAFQIEMQREIQSDYLESMSPILKNANRALKLRSLVTIGSIRSVIRQTTISAYPPPELSQKNKQYTEICSFLRDTLQVENPAPPQCAMSIYALPGGCVLQASDSFGHALFLKIPIEADPIERVRRALNVLRHALAPIVGASDPLTIVNGDAIGLNFKNVFRDQTVLRTFTSSAKELSGRIENLYAQAPISPADTAIVGGIPRSEAEIRAVLGPQADIAPWQGIHDTWSSTSESHGFVSSQGTKESFLEALGSKKNVIVIVAHGDSQSIWFPNPPPSGSQAVIGDLDSVADKIRENKPSIYMYTCESASAEGLENWSSRLLDYGAAAVFAPEGKVSAMGTRSLFDGFLTYGKSQSPLKAFTEAERKTALWEVQTWIA